MYLLLGCGISFDLNKDKKERSCRRRRVSRSANSFGREVDRMVHEGECVLGGGGILYV
jgi:hypothetical protein